MILRGSACAEAFFPSGATVESAVSLSVVGLTSLVELSEVVLVWSDSPLSPAVISFVVVAFVSLSRT